MKVVFSSASVTLLPEVIENGAIGSVPSDIDPEDVELERVVCANIGGPTLRPHLIVSKADVYLTSLHSPRILARYI